MVTITEDDNDNVPLAQSLQELTTEQTITTSDVAGPKLEYANASRIVRSGPKLGADG
ncbi:hypothetical protein IWW50_002547, partial [Coemansia erecta]